VPHYSYEKTFTAGTDAKSQESLEMKCAEGVLTDVAISFPAGCHGVVHVHLDEALHQVFPTNAESNYALDDFTLPINDRYNLGTGTKKLILKGWNEGTYNHTIRVAFRIVTPDQLTVAEQVLLSIFNLLNRIFFRRAKS
jgi:uncharacterized phage protein gp47/JayE